jgi:hypothetical protein
MGGNGQLDVRSKLRDAIATTRGTIALSCDAESIDRASVL